MPKNTYPLLSRAPFAPAMPVKFHPRRAVRAEKALEFYKRGLGESGPISSETIRDLVQDCLHWMADPKNDYRNPRATLREAVADACRDFPRELKEDEPDAPVKVEKPRCYRCERIIRDAEYRRDEDGTVRHLNACPPPRGGY